MFVERLVMFAASAICCSFIAVRGLCPRMIPTGIACAPRSVMVTNIGGGVLRVSVASITGMVTRT